MKMITETKSSLFFFFPTETNILDKNFLWFLATSHGLLHQVNPACLTIDCFTICGSQAGLPSWSPDGLTCLHRHAPTGSFSLLTVERMGRSGHYPNHFQALSSPSSTASAVLFQCHQPPTITWEPDFPGHTWRLPHAHWSWSRNQYVAAEGSLHCVLFGSLRVSCLLKL